MGRQSGCYEKKNSMTTIPIFQFHALRKNDLRFEIARMSDKPVLQQLGQQPRRDNFFIIFLISAGRGTYFIDFERYPVAPHMLFCIAPHQVHYWQLESPVDGHVIIFTEDLLMTNMAYNTTRFPEDFTIFNWETPSGFEIPELYRGRMGMLTHVLTSEYENTDHFQSQLAIQSALLLMLINIQRAFDGSATRESRAGMVLLRQFTALVNTEFRTLTSVQHYASQLGVTSGHLSDTVSELTGHPPLNMLHRRIILEAKRLLIHTDDPISMIALALSFSDPSYFGRFFKREMGETPLQFRSRFR